jgi:AmiR/NasT family two-component response regulator
MNEKAKQNGGVSADMFDRIRVLEAENELLRIGVESRVILERAAGAVSARCDISCDAALKMIRGLARSQRREVHVYAREIIANGGRFSPEE